MKKTILFILILIFSLFFAACIKAENNEDTKRGIGIKVTVGENEFIAKLYDNKTAKALADMLPLTLNMSELNGNEKYNYLPVDLPTVTANPGTIQTGDIMLYGSNCLVLFYKSFSTSYSYTKIGRIDDATDLVAAIGSGSVIIKFELIEGDVSGESENPDESSEPEMPNEPIEPVEPIKPIEPEIPNENEVNTMLITISGNTFKAELYDNQTAKAFAEKLPLKINMSELNANEKYYYLPENLPDTATSAGTIQAGDIMLWGNNCLVLFYKSFSTQYSYTKIGRIEDVTGLAAALGSGSVTVTFQ